MARKSHESLSDSPQANTAVSKSVSDSANGVQAVQAGMGQKVQRDGKSKKEAAASAGAAIVPNSQVLARSSQSSASGSREISRFYPDLPETVAMRDTVIRSKYDDDPIQTDLPAEMVSFLAKWLHHNHLTFCTMDQDFWDAFAHVMTSLESFSIEAVEQALLICLAGAGPADRRAAIYSELRSVRELRKIRNFEMKLQTSRLLVDRFLVPSSETGLAKLMQEKAELDASVEATKAYVVVTPVMNHEMTPFGPFQTVTEAQEWIQRRVIADTRTVIRWVGLNSDGKIVRNYGDGNDESEGVSVKPPMTVEQP